MSSTSPSAGLERWIVPVLIICFCVVAIWISTTFEEMPPILKRGIQPADFPQLILGLIIFCTVIMVLRDPVTIDGSLGSKPFGTLILMMGFVALTQVDFFLALGVFAGVLTVYWGERRLPMILLVGVVTPIVVFFLFDSAFEIRFPKGVLTNLWYG